MDKNGFIEGRLLLHGINVPYKTKVNDYSKFIGKKISRVSCHIGTYGMGGSGFIGLQVGFKMIVFAVWHATDAVMYNNKKVSEYEDIRSVIKGLSIEKTEDKFTIKLTDGRITSELVLDKSVELDNSHIQETVRGTSMDDLVVVIHATTNLLV